MDDWKVAGRTQDTMSTFSHESGPQNHDCLKKKNTHKGFIGKDLNTNKRMILAVYIPS